MSTAIYPSNFTASLLASFDRESEHKRLLASCFHIPLANITKTDRQLDRAGADYLVRLQNTRLLSVDIKDRSAGCQRFWNGPQDPDIAIELVSNRERNLPGSMVVDSPYPDVYAFIFGDLAGHLFTLPARPLRRVVRKHMDRWLRDYGLRQNRTIDYTGTGSYTTCYVFVPWSVVSPLVAWDAATTLVDVLSQDEQQ